MWTLIQYNSTKRGKKAIPKELWKKKDLIVKHQKGQRLTLVDAYVPET